MSAQAIAEQLNSENVLAPSEYKRLCGLNYHSGFKAGTSCKVAGDSGTSNFEE